MAKEKEKERKEETTRKENVSVASKQSTMTTAMTMTIHTTRTPPGTMNQGTTLTTMVGLILAGRLLETTGLSMNGVKVSNQTTAKNQDSEDKQQLHRDYLRLSSSKR